MHPSWATRSLAALTFGLMGLIGCGELRTTNTEGPFVGSTYVSSGVSENGQPKAIAPGTKLTLTFTADGITASAGCNTLFASGGISDGVLVLSDLGGTEMACDPAVMEQERWWGQFLTSRPRAAVAEQSLTLSTPTATVAMASQQRVPDLPLAGIDWQLDTIVSREAASNIPIASAMSVTDTTLTVAVAGCRQTAVPVAITATTMTYDAAAFAVTSCTEAAAAADEAVMAVYGSGSVTYLIEGDRLTISGPDAHALGYRGS